METTIRFAQAVASLDQVRLLGVFQRAPRGQSARLFDDIVEVPDAMDAGSLAQGVVRLARRHGRPHRLLGVLEEMQGPLATVREHLGITGPDRATADRFRDKARMKDVLRAHGIPCARHRLLHGESDAVDFARQVPFPWVLKPPAGAGCRSTWRIHSRADLARALRATRPGPFNPVLAEEFLQGREYSFETLTVGGTPRFHSISHYLPGPLEAVENPWIQWCAMLPRDISGPQFDGARQLAARTIQALGIRDAMTHMEWFRRPDGSLAVGEIAARPPGAQIVRMMSYAHDTDMYRAWARAVVDEDCDGPWERRYAVGVAFLRGSGQGRVAQIDGLDRAQALAGSLVVETRLPRTGMPRSSSYEGDGWVIFRHPDTRRVEQALRHTIQSVRVRYAA
jgi:hypothetical protein